MKKLKQKRIRIYSPKHAEMMQLELFKLGATWVSGKPEVSCTHAVWLFIDNKLQITYSSDPAYGEVHEYKLLETDKLLSIVNEFNAVEFYLNYDYKAIIKENDVVVGCQTFPNKVIDDFITAYTEAHAKDKK